MDSALGRTLLRLVGACLLAVAVVGLVAPRAVNTPYRWYVVVPACLALVAVAAFARSPRWVRARWVRPVLAVVGGVVATLVGLAGRYEYGWDARVVMDLARALHAGRPVGDGGYDYLSLYPNNLPLLAIDRAGVEVGSWVGWSPDAVLIVVTGVCVTVTLLAVDALVRRVRGPGAAIGAQLVTLVLVGTSPWLTVPYTDYFAMPFLAAGVALAGRALLPGAASAGEVSARARTARVLTWVAAVVCYGVAYAIKTTPAVVVIATVLTVVVAVFDGNHAPRGRVTALAGSVVAVVVFLGIAVATPVVSAQAAGVDSSRLRADVTPPVLWWLANGMNEQVGPDGVVSYGTYSRDMVEAIAGRTPDQMTDYARTYISDRWAKRGPGGTLAFYADKVAWNWGDGMFWAWGEGPDSLPGRLADADGTVGVVHSLNGFHGSAYPWRADVTQALWLAVLLVAGAGLLRAPYRRDVLLVALTVLGIATFTLLFQGRSRYVFTFAPLVVALAAMVRLRAGTRGRRAGAVTAATANTSDAG
ncbi:hypothetical protein [Intrasporangium sp. YIM S08009]|uniref:hypothetical protein n=1 Tax=Intrasporangium zincisolvens TaxID=3080018 RepID=UPI002B061AAE|nr:hypothetical protein [Intrasporangium sp. YIM S08009]